MKSPARKEWSRAVLRFLFDPKFTPEDYARWMELDKELRARGELGKKTEGNE